MHLRDCALQKSLNKKKKPNKVTLLGDILLQTKIDSAFYQRIKFASTQRVFLRSYEKKLLCSALRYAFYRSFKYLRHDFPNMEI